MIDYSQFPRLTPSNHRITSPSSPAYNCVTWSSGDVLETRQMKIGRDPIPDSIRRLYTPWLLYGWALGVFFNDGRMFELLGWTGPKWIDRYYPICFLLMTSLLALLVFIFRVVLSREYRT